MPIWTPKSTAPTTFNMGQAFTAEVTGDPNWAWLLAWESDLGALNFVTTDFCSGGPDTVSPLTLDDFTTDFDNPLVMFRKIRAVAQDRLFGAYCEQAGVAAGSGVYGPWVSIEMTGNEQPYPSMRIEASCGTVQMRQTTITLASPGNTIDNNVHFTSDAHGLDPDYANFGWPQTLNVIETKAWQGPGTMNFQTFGAPTDHFTLEFRWDQQAIAAIDHTPTDQPPVIGALPPATNTYLSIPDLGAELDRQEYKLDQLRQTVAFMVQNQTTPDISSTSTTTTDPVPVDPTTPTDVPSGSVGVVVTITNIPPGHSEDFWVPPRYARLAFLALGTAAGWLPAIRIEYTPFLYVPLPPWVTRIQVSATPGATATVSFLKAL